MLCVALWAQHSTRHMIRHSILRHDIWQMNARMPICRYVVGLEYTAKCRVNIESWCHVLRHIVMCWIVCCIALSRVVLSIVSNVVRQPPTFNVALWNIEKNRSSSDNKILPFLKALDWSSVFVHNQWHSFLAFILFVSHVTFDMFKYISEYRMFTKLLSNSIMNLWQKNW